MEQVAHNMSDTLGTLMVYRYELDAIVVKLESAQRNNTILAIVLVCIIVASNVAAFYFIRHYREKMRSSKLSNKLLHNQAAAMPLFTDRVNKLSAKGIKLSGKLYEEFQAAIDDVKRSSKSGFVEIVNDADFARQYPYIKDFPNLGVQEKIVLILVEENFTTTEIALHLGITDNGVRAIKSKIRGKIKESPMHEKYIKKLKILNS